MSLCQLREKVEGKNTCCTEEKKDYVSANPGYQVAYRRQMMSPVSVVFVSYGDTCTLVTNDRAA